MCREGLTRGISWGKRSRAIIKVDVGSTLLEAAPVQVFGHGADTCFTVVVITNIPCCPSLGHLYFVFVRLCVGVPYDSGIF